MRSTPNFLLNVWDSLMDRFNHAELASNWDKIDAHDHTGGTKGLQIPTSGIVNGAVDATKIANSLKPSGLATDSTESLRRLGTVAGTALPGNSIITRGQLEAIVQQALFSAGDLKPTAAAVTAGTEPAGWLVCDGRSKLRADYLALFNALGGNASPWGLPDGTHFNLPDLRGRIVQATTLSLPGSLAIPPDANSLPITSRLLADKAGAETHLLTGPQSGVNSGGTGSASNSGAWSQNSVLTDGSLGGHWAFGTDPGSADIHIATISQSNHTHPVTLNSMPASSYHNNLQPSVAVNYLIKT